jgi:ribonucleoside-diphosphate reductase alpha chain
VLKLVNNHVPAALARLNYSQEEIQNIANYIIDKETIEGAPGIREEDLPVFDCSFKAKNGVRSINYMGHIRMMGAVQPFISGAISKTVNLPADATVDDIKDAFMQAWRHGLKAIAVYRDGCKSVQPLNTSADDKKRIERIDGYTRVKLPAERNSITHRFSVNNHKGYLTVGLYPETNKPGETFITIAKEGSTLSGLFDVIATLTSICLQSGVPLKSLVQYFKDSRFEPSGFTSNPEIPFAKSFVDYIFRYMGNRFLNEKDREEIFGHANGGVKNGDFELNGLNGDNTSLTKTKTEEIRPVATTANWDESAKNAGTDAPPCEKCGSMMFRAGSCFSCPNCFNTTGVCN